jgi:radical SAM superfamily enzyme YgiQ (UPF0313 family)
MKIVFIQPNVGFKGHTWEALGIGYLISYLKQHFQGNLDIDFYSGFYDTDDKIINTCHDADIIGFSCTSPQFKHGLTLARQIKNNNNRIVFGGVHPSALPELVLKEDCIDAVVAGEGEKSMLQLVKDVSSGNIKRIYTADYIQNLDDLPFPDRKTIKNERNIDQAFRDGGERITSVLSSRGCPFRCTFCSSHILWERHTRFRSAANIIAEVEWRVDDWKIQVHKV